MSVYIITEGDQAHQDVTELLQRLKATQPTAGNTLIQTKAALENLHEDTLLMDSNGKIWQVADYYRELPLANMKVHQAALVYALPAVIVATSDQIQESREKLGIEK